MPSSSARCAQFPRAQDKVHYYIKLKDLRDQLKGIERNTDVQEVHYTFDLQLAQGRLLLLLPLFISHAHTLGKACCGCLWLLNKVHFRIVQSQFKSFLPSFTEDAKKMAVKEEKYDPGYEAAYGGAYGENPCSSEPCSFSNGLSMFPSMCVCVCVCACVRARVCLSKTCFGQEEGTGV
jgi:TDG/mug DNA glycosylase family protein